MEHLLIAGVLFWMAMAFFGTRNAYRSGEGPLRDLQAAIKRRSPVLLLVIAVMAAAMAFGLVFSEIAAVDQLEGVIGLRFVVAVAFGVIGSICLSAQLYLHE